MDILNRLWKLPVCAVLMPVLAAAEVVCALGPNPSSYKASSDQRPTADAMELANHMSDVITPLCTPRCPQIPVLRNPTAANIMLIVTQNDAKVVYNPQFFQTVYDTFGEGAIIAVLAHEFGHALDEVFPGKFGKGGTPELRADAWAGCALARADLKPVALGQALSALSKYPSPAHPEWPVRLAALKLGFTQCAGDASKLGK